jgi:hypothetical protein
MIFFMIYAYRPKFMLIYGLKIEISHNILGSLPLIIYYSLKRNLEMTSLDKMEESGSFEHI